MSAITNSTIVLESDTNDNNGIRVIEGRRRRRKYFNIMSNKGSSLGISFYR